MLKDHAGGAPIPQPPRPSTVLCNAHGRYCGAAESASLRRAAHHQLPAGDVPAKLRPDGTRACLIDLGACLV
jgi:hypothetical protein